MEKPEIEVEIEKSEEIIEAEAEETEIEVKDETIVKTQDKVVEIDTKPEAFNHNALNTLLENNVSENGNVDYKNLKAQRTDLSDYIESLTNNVPNESWSKEDKLAYWINAYNALTIDLILRNYPLNSIKDIDKPWDQRLWKFGDKWQNLNDIEHQILRKMDEPRIHFAIVCASFSCPKLQNTAFTASNLEELLTNATKEFLADENRNNISENSLKLSKIFKWFAKDFKTNGSLIDFLNKYTEVEISSKAKKSFKDYNWDLND
ncbi:MAG: DUF547 domain-containing protein [Winogradskyella sp.]|nr:MAG: DUF547 domain-containing protein [Winogradskyella sp.]